MREAEFFIVSVHHEGVKHACADPLLQGKPIKQTRQTGESLGLNTSRYKGIWGIDNKQAFT